MGVVGRELEVPAQLAGGRIKGNERTAVQVVAGAIVAVPVRGRIAGAPVEQVQLRVVRPAQPRGSPARLPAVAAPRVVPLLAGSRHRVEPPQAPSGPGVVGVEEAAHAGFAPADADDDLAVNGQRRRRDRVAERVVGDLHVPTHRAGHGVERDQVCVQRADVHAVVEQCDAPVGRAEANGPRGFRDLGLEAPQRTSAAKIERCDAASRLGDVHHAIGDQRRDLRWGPRFLHLVHPRRPKS